MKDDNYGNRVLIADQFDAERVNGKEDCANWDLVALITVKAYEYQEEEQENIRLTLLYPKVTWNQGKQASLKAFKLD